MPIPDSQPKYSDLIDIMITASQVIDTVEDENGKPQKQSRLEPDKLWWKTHIVNSPTFGRFAKEFTDFENLAVQCFDNMSPERAKGMHDQIMAFCRSFRTSIDAKSSETLRDKQNSQSNLIDKINRNKIERAITLKGEAKRTFADSLMGREAEKTSEEN